MSTIFVNPGTFDTDALSPSPFEEHLLANTEVACTLNTVQSDSLDGGEPRLCGRGLNETTRRNPPPS
jgi:hypothetical protein